jgi:Ca2+-binding RTX toxin-like protein
MRRALLAAIVLLAVPATADAATVTVAGTPAAIEFKAAAGEVNDLSVNDFADPVRGHGLAFTDAGAPLTAGEGCDPAVPVLCPILDVNARLGDRNDRASVFSLDTDASVWGEAGNDDILASGFESLADGGAGNDTVRVNSNSSATALGGAGNDEIHAASPFAVTARGGSGNDRVLHESSTIADLLGGSGADVILGLPLSGGAVEAHGGAGPDILAIRSEGGNGDPAAWLLAGNAGPDLIAGGPGPDTVRGGDGRDGIWVAGGGADTVSCGSGFDIVVADASDTLSKDCERRIVTSSTAVSREITGALRQATR